MSDLEIIMAIITVLFGGGGALAGWTALRKAPDESKLLNANAYNQLVDSIAKMSDSIADLEDKRKEDKELIGHLEGEVRSLKNTVGRLRNGIGRLIDQIKSSGMTPVWTPDDLDDIK